MRIFFVTLHLLSLCQVVILRHYLDINCCILYFFGNFWGQNYKKFPIKKINSFWAKASFFRLKDCPNLKMSCNTCDKSFGLVTREKDCKNCGFSYCSSCLRYKQYVAKVNQNVKVCGPCNRVLSNPKWVMFNKWLVFCNYNPF